MNDALIDITKQRWWLSTSKKESWDGRRRLMRPRWWSTMPHPSPTPFGKIKCRFPGAGHAFARRQRCLHQWPILQFSPDQPSRIGRRSFLNWARNKETSSSPNINGGLLRNRPGSATEKARNDYHCALRARDHIGVESTARFAYEFGYHQFSWRMPWRPVPRRARHDDQQAIARIGLIRKTRKFGQSANLNRLRDSRQRALSRAFLQRVRFRPTA